MRERLSVLAAIAAVAALLFAACDIEVDNPAPAGDPALIAGAGGDGTIAGDGTTTGGGTTAPPPTPASATYAVNVVGMQFKDGRSGSVTSTCKVGDTIVWTNGDSMEHTVTSDTGAFNGTLAQRGTTFSFKFTKAGSYPYTCLRHKSSMKGTVVVQP